MSSLPQAEKTAPKVNSCDQEDKFIDEFRESLGKGLGFLPLVGAGLSAPSGVPIIFEIQEYLTKCIVMALGLCRNEVWTATNIAKPGELHRGHRWLPGRDAWPPFGDPQIYKRDVVDWSKRLNQFLNELIRLSDTGTRHPELKVFQEAFGASADWRSSLIFLSRLRLVTLESDAATERATTPSLAGRTRSKPAPPQLRLDLGPPDLDVIDTFFLTVVLGKRPTLGHRMLARLAGPLRMGMVLTTNFDDLIERAFEEVGNVLTVFDVHVQAGLPPLRDMQARNSLVKLHGGRYGLRADYSLDSLPSESDRRQFVSYLADRIIADEEWLRPDRVFEARRHLLVLGVSANDQRVVALVEAACRSFNEQFRIFWLAYSDRDEIDAQKLLRRVFRENANRFMVLRHKFPGLLFLQMYQELTRALPPSGAIFPSAPRIPCPPQSRFKRSHRRQLEENCSAINREIELCTDPGAVPRPSRLLVLHSAPEETAAWGVSIAAEVFEKQIDQKRQCVWVDLDEIENCDEMFEVILDTIARKAGVVDWMPVSIGRFDAPYHPVTDFQVSEISRLTNNPNRKWVVFLNARSVAGSNLRDDKTVTLSNGWLDDERDAKGAEPDMIRFLRRVSGADCPNVTVVLLCFKGAFLRYLNQSDLHPIYWELRPLTAQRPPSPAETAIAWVKRGNPSEQKHRAQFLYALCLTNRPRYRCFLWSWPFHLHDQRTTANRVEAANRYVKELEERRVVRRKPGGFLWMHCAIRNELRKRLPESFDLPVEDAARTHHGLADWYRRLFLASNEPSAAFEIVYHRCLQAQSLIRERPDNEEAQQQVLQALADSQFALEHATSSLLASGFSKGICRRLDHVRNVLIRDLEETLQVKVGPKRPDEPIHVSETRRLLSAIRIVILKLNRLVGREVGENPSAFKRHLQLRHARIQERGKQSLGDEEVWLRQDKRGKKIRRQLLSRHDGCGDRSEPLAEWINHTTELATLGIAGRCFDYALKSFKRIYQAIGFNHAKLHRKTDIQRAWRQWLLELPGEGGSIPAWLLELAKPREEQASTTVEVLVPDKHELVWSLCNALRREAQMHVSRGHLSYVMHRRAAKFIPVAAGDGHVAEHFHKACCCYESAIELMRYLNYRPPQPQRPLSITTSVEAASSWLMLRQRLDVYHALALAFLKDFDKAHRRLNEAESAAAALGAGAGSIEVAIIELHRAEVLTHQAVYVATPSRAKRTGAPISPLGQLRNSILHGLAKHDYDHVDPQSRDSAGRLDHSSKLQQFLDDLASAAGCHHDLKQALSFVDDAWQTLARAEPVLFAGRKNVWWTTWFFELRLKLIELRIFANLCVSNCVHVPVVGLRDTPYGAPSLADRLLNDSFRMIRLDVYRMGRIVESFANCLLGLLLARYRARDYSETAFLAERQSEMRDRLLQASQELIARKTLRLSYDLPRFPTHLSPEVKDYLDFVADHVKRIAYLAESTINL